MLHTVMHCIYIFHTFIIYDFIFMLYFISFYSYSHRTLVELLECGYMMTSLNP